MAKRTKKRPSTRRNASVTPAMLEQFAGLFPGGQVTPAILKRVGAEYAKVSNPGRGAFKRCVQEVAAKGGAYSPRAVCAAAARKKYGSAKLKKMAAAGRKRALKNPRGRRNPVDDAAAVYERFHGRPPEEVIEVKETIEEHSVLSGIGKLVSLTVWPVQGTRAVKIEQFRGAMLAQNEKATQLFIVGGDQSVNVSDFGIESDRTPHEFEILGAAVEVAYLTRKDHLGKSGGEGERAVHVHDFGSLRQVEGSDSRRRRGSRLPIVVYDTRNKKLSLAGGGYDLPEVGIRG
jgi:hypothetical protein